MLVIIHGWSDDAKSFNAIAKRLAEVAPKGIGKVVAEIYLGDYISLDDQVTFDDLVEAMNEAWTNSGLSTAPHSVDAVVHSAGGLVFRHWLAEYFTPDTAPIKRLLMLAPANFGSPLAHTGRSIIGRVVKGWNLDRPFETGEKILKGLELASPYSWNLAQRDLFRDDSYYGVGRILCTVIVGNTGYSGIAAVANKPGSDGTVRVSTANLNAASLELDLLKPLAEVPIRVHDQTAFAIADGEDHGSITGSNGGPRNDTTWQLFREALTVTDSNFDAWKARLHEHTDLIVKAANARDEHFHCFQNTVIRVIDSHGEPVNDYMIELYVNDDESEHDRNLTQIVQEKVINSVHVFGDNHSMRSMLIDCTKLNELMLTNEFQLKLSISAFPDMTTSRVGYKTYTDDDIPSLALGEAELKLLFQPNRTVLITLRLKRHQNPEVFQFKRPTSPA